MPKPSTLVGMFLGPFPLPLPLPFTLLRSLSFELAVWVPHCRWVGLTQSLVWHQCITKCSWWQGYFSTLSTLLLLVFHLLACSCTSSRLWVYPAGNPSLAQHTTLWARGLEN